MTIFMEFKAACSQSEQPQNTCQTPENSERLWIAFPVLLIFFQKSER